MSTFRVVILSARASNLVPCVRALLEQEPDLDPADVIVVDDGARAEAEAWLPGVTWVTGEKPFVFARNANIGLRAAGSADVLLLNDDARLIVSRGVTQLATLVRSRPDVGLCSAAVHGVVGNPRQQPAGQLDLRLEAEGLAFVAIFIPRHVYERLGPLDERFTGYGFEDNDYCTRARAAGWHLAIADCCVVDHSGDLPSTFRTRGDLWEQFHMNRQLYEAKQMGGDALTPVDIMYLACNRLEYTRETFNALLANTDWDLAGELHVYDDGSTDGTCEWLEQRLRDAPCRSRLVRTSFASPVAAMGHFIESATAPMLAKCDNDAMYPPRWLRESIDVFRRHPELDLLGIEAMYPADGRDGVDRTYQPAIFISGLGLYRRRVFAQSRPEAFDKWFGLEEWQQARPAIARGWISPALEVFLLDRCPFEPWISWTEHYIERGWMRRWPKYDPASTLWQWRWPVALPA